MAKKELGIRSFAVSYEAFLHTCESWKLLKIRTDLQAFNLLDKNLRFSFDIPAEIAGEACISIKAFLHCRTRRYREARSAAYAELAGGFFPNFGFEVGFKVGPAQVLPSYTTELIAFLHGPLFDVWCIPTCPSPVPLSDFCNLFREHKGRRISQRSAKETLTALGYHVAQGAIRELAYLKPRRRRKTGVC